MIRTISGMFMFLGWLSHNYEIMIIFGLTFLVGILIEK